MTVNLHLSHPISRLTESFAFIQPSASHYFVDGYPMELQEAINFLVSDADVLRLLDEIVNATKPENKKIDIQFSSDIDGVAKYDYSKNIIIIKKECRNQSLEELVPHIFFELQNAKQRDAFINLDDQALKIGKELYVEQVERLEYNSTLATHLYVRRIAHSSLRLFDIRRGNSSQL